MQELIQAILPYVKTDYLKANATPSAYVFDNNVMSHLAKSAREHPEDFKLMIQAIDLSNIDIIIPEIILHESAGNHWMTAEEYERLYLPLFQMLSAVTNIYVLTLDDAFAILSDGSVNTNDAWQEFQLMSISLNKANETIKSAIKAAKSVDEVDKALTLSPKDAGERIAHIISCSLLMNGLEKVTLLSEEETGVYNIRKLVSRDEIFLETMRMWTPDIFLESYALESFECILYKTLRNNMNWPLNEKETFLDRNRSERSKKRPVRYSLSSNTFDHIRLENNEFALFVHNNPSARIIF